MALVALAGGLSGPSIGLLGWAGGLVVRRLFAFHGWTFACLAAARPGDRCQPRRPRAA